MLFDLPFRRLPRAHRTGYRRRPATRPAFVPRLEMMEDRTLLSVSALFDVPTGTLALRGDAGDNTVRETLSPGGFLELMLDGQRHSSDPASAFFDRSLAGASAGALTAIWFDGGRHDTLTMGSQKLVGGLRVNASSATVVTEGVIAAHSIELAAGVFVNSGQIHAGSQVLVHAAKVLNAGGLTDDVGGSVHIEFTDSYIDTSAAVTSGGSTGRLFSSGTFRATGPYGGSVDLFGREVVLDGATVDASGQAGGGSVRIGGDFQGRTVGQVFNLHGLGGQVANLPHGNAQTVTITGATALRADALGQGNGGRVIVWADQQTTFAGSVSARGGPGDAGGFIEVSARGQLNYSGSADAGALHGKAGTLLLDPKNLVISAAPAGVLPQFDLIDPHPTAGAGFGSLFSVRNTGNVLVFNPNDDFGGASAGAAYLFNGLTGALISALVGSEDNDRVGDSVHLLRNDNYLVKSYYWHDGRGALTWGGATAGVSGVVSEANSLIGSSPGEHLGAFGALEVRNGNYVVPDPSWKDGRGAVTWVNGSTGQTIDGSGIISEANSLIGSNPDDTVGTFLTTLSNGNYVVSSINWHGNRGAATWGDGTTGVSGVVSEANSLVGSNPGPSCFSRPPQGDCVGINIGTPSNGNYLVGSLFWNSARGAVTWGDGTKGVRGPISEANSLVGSSPDDQVGINLAGTSSGNYLVGSRFWNGHRGAVTWGDGTTGVRGTISEANSLVGSNPNDQVGFTAAALSNGNFLILTPFWNGNRGAVTWFSGTGAVHGAVSEANSLVGSSPNDYVGTLNPLGESGLKVLSNGNYVVASPLWNANRGAVTWGDGTTGVSGVISEANSLVGTTPGPSCFDPPYGDCVGLNIGTPSNGNYLVGSRFWNSARGAVTWGDGTTGVRGTISEANSLVGSNPNDQVGFRATALSNGNFLIGSPFWNGNRGAVTWFSSTGEVHGTVSEANSLVGSSPNDYVGARSPLGESGLTVLSNGNYLVGSLNWNGNRGAATWGDGATGVRGVISEANSLIGSNPGDMVGTSVFALTNGNYVVGSPNWNSNRGAATWGDGTGGVKGAVSEANSLVGGTSGDMVGASRSVTALSSGNYVVLIPTWNGNRGAATWADGSTGVRGLVSEANSLVGSNPGDRVGFGFGFLRSGNYVIRSPFWNGNRGAVTWGDGSTGVRGVVSEANSLVGSSPNDYVGSGDTAGSSFLFSLSNGNLVVVSPLWHNRHGAATWINGATGQTLDGRGTISGQNSLVGAADNAGLGFERENAVTQTFLVAFVTEGGGRVTAGLVDPNGLTYALGQDQTVTITPDFLTRTLNTGTAVVLQASNDITVNDPITVNAGGQGGALTLQAGRSILLNASITTDNGDLTLIANDTLANGVVDAERDPGLALITMADGTSLDTGAGALTVELRDGAGRINTDSGAITLQTVAAGSVSVANDGPSAGSDIVLGPVTTAGAQSYSNPNGTTLVTGNLTATDSPVSFTDSVILNAGLTLSAGSSVVTFAGGMAVSPGALTVAGGMVLSDSATFSATLNGTDAGCYSHVTAGGPVDLGGSTLNLTLGFTPEMGDSFALVTSEAGPITGTFAGLAEGATFTQNGMLFQITYQGGPNGNSVVLTRVG